jgi:2-desacetyl-2-hydroxyethyl bacteriochlorophyllide A dehydrogenase
MKYIICDDPNNLALKLKEQPTLTDGNALLKIKRVGICGTDLHAFKGNQAFLSYPRILGHELAAEILEIETNDGGLRAGDKVVILPYINCEKCSACKVGKSNCCENLKVFGVHTDGGMQEVISYAVRLLIPANDLSLEEIAIVEPLSIGAHALRRAQIKQGDVIAVIGCGPIGVGIIQLAKYIGATVMVLDINDDRLATAREKFGADFILNPQQSPVEKIKEFTKGELAATVFDATGSKHAIESGLNYMRHGGTFVLVGLSKGELSFQHPQLHAKEATLMCSRNATPEDFKFVMKVLREGKFNTSAYITKKVGFEAILSAFDDWASPISKEIKIVTVWD